MIRLLSVLFLLVLVACGTAQPATPANQARDEEVQPESIEVVVRESNPVQVAAQVKATLGSGCYSFKEITQERNGNEITLKVIATNSGAEMCTMIAQMVDQQVTLEGDFPAGEYTIKAGDIVETFTI